MADKDQVMKALEHCVVSGDFCGECPYDGMESCIEKLHDDALALLKDQEKIKSQEEFSKIIHGMFDYLWDCEIEHPIFQDTVGDLMNAVIQAYGLAVKWE